VDEGTLMTSRLEDIIIDLPDFYRQFEPQAKKCCLKDAEPASLEEASNEWCWEAIDFFRSICRQGDLTVKSIEKKRSSSPSYYENEYIVEAVSK
jgi:hypothetical protein